MTAWVRFCLAACLSLAGLTAAQAQLPVLSNVLLRAGKGVLLGNPTNQQAGMFGYNPATTQYVVWSVASNAFVPLAASTVSGSGTLTGLVTQAGSGSSDLISFSNNPARPDLGYLTYVLTNSTGSFLPTTGGSVTGNVSITGGLTVYGTQTIYNAVTINSYTTYNFGVSTTYTYTTVYSTQVVYQTVELNIQTNITYSTIDAYSGWNFIGAYLNATGAPYVWAPHFRDTLTNRLDANGVWSFSNATVVGLTAGGVASQDVRSSVSGWAFTNNAASTVSVLIETGSLVLANGLTVGGDLNANGHLEIANTKHLRFTDGGGTNRVHIEASVGRLVVSGAIDVVSGQATPFTVNGGTYLATNGVLSGGGNNLLVISNGNGNVYLAVSSNQTAAVTNAVQVVSTDNTTSTPTSIYFSGVTGAVAGAELTVYLSSQGVSGGSSTNANLPLHITRQVVGVTNEDVSYTADYTTTLTQMTPSNTVEVAAFLCARTSSVQQAYIVASTPLPLTGAYTNLLTTWHNSNLATNVGVIFRLQTLQGAWTETTNAVSNGSVITSTIPPSASPGDILTLRAYFTNLIGTTNIFLFGPRRIGAVR